MSRIPIRLSSPRKYGNRKTVVDNITFDSAKEAKRYQELKILSNAGQISRFELQPTISIDLNGIHVCTYRGDFAYIRNGSFVVEDAKGLRTAVYKLKKKLVRAQYGIDIQEV